MGCGCVPYVVSSSGACNQTYSMCSGGSLYIPVTPTCSVAPTVVGIPAENYTSTTTHVTVFGLTENTTFTYTCGAKTCTVTLIMQEPNEGAHTILLNACGSQCTNGLPTSYEWTGFTGNEGCIELAEGYSPYDCEIKVIVFNDEQCSINLKVCCGNCGDNCCKTTVWTWNPPTFNDNCIPDCTMYPCTTYDEATGNCVPTCEDCELCCSNYTSVIALLDIDRYIKSIKLFDGVTNIVVPTDLLLPAIGANAAAYETAINNALTAQGINGSVTVVYTTVLTITYTGPNLYMKFVKTVQIDVPHGVTLILPITVGSSTCADCCDNLGCQLDNCLHQPVCQAGECKCYVDNVEVPALPNGCCPGACYDGMVLPACTECTEGIIVDTAPTCTEPFSYLNTTTCSCTCPPGLVTTPDGCVDPIVNCTSNPELCGICEQCLLGACTTITNCGTGNMPNPIPNTAPCCVSDPCVLCSETINVNRVCMDIIPISAVAVGITYKIKFGQLASVAYGNSCSYLDQLGGTVINSTLAGAVYEINYTNYINDWLPIAANPSNELITYAAIGNGFLIKCSWKGRVVVYEFFFSDLGIATIKEVSLANCLALYKASTLGTCLVHNMSWTSDLTISGPINQNPIVVVLDDEPTVEGLCITADIMLLSPSRLCSTTTQCVNTPGCEGGCGCPICEPGSNSTVETIIDTTVTGQHITLHASVLKDCPNDTAGLMFTCAPPMNAEFVAYQANNLALPDDCGTLPGMFLTKPTCTNCATFDCVPETVDEAEQLCGWWVDVDNLVPNSLWINGSNIEFELLRDADYTDVCFGINTECGYTCNCIKIEQPIPPAEFAMVCNTIYKSSLMQNINHQPGGVNEFTLPISNTMVCEGTIDIILDYSFELQMDRLEVLYNNILVAATPYVGAICNALPTNPTTYITPCNGITTTDIFGTSTLCYDCGWYESINLLPSNINNNQGACNTAPPNWATIIPSYSFRYLTDGVTPATNYAGQGRLRIVVPYNGTTNELKIKVHNNPDEELNANSDQGTGGAITQLCASANGTSITDWSIKALCTTCKPVSCPPPVIQSVSNDCDGGVGHFNITTPCTTGTIEYSYSTNSTEDVNAVTWSAWVDTIPIWEDGLWLKARCSDDEGCTSISSNIVFADHVNCDCDLSTYTTNTCLPGFSSGQYTLTEILVHIAGGVGPYTITSQVQLYNGVTLLTTASSITGLVITGPTHDILDDGVSGHINVSVQTGQHIEISYTVTDSTGTCSATVDDFIILCPNPDPTYECVNGIAGFDCVLSPTGVPLIDCKEDCIGAVAKLCDDVVTVTNTPNHTSIFAYDLTSYTPNNVYYLDAAFGGKPEKYKIYQVNAFNVKTLIAETPYLGCGCTPTNKALSGFWTNVDGLTQSGDYDDTTAADGNTPFKFGGNTLNPFTKTTYAALNYSGYVSGNPNMGYTYDFIPNNSAWVDHYDSSCNVNGSRDYDACGTCTPLTYEEVNATALGRIYFKYLPSFGALLQVEVEHGILGTTCPPYDANNQHGVKFTISCTNIPQELCEPVTGSIIGEEPANPPLFSRYEYTPVCVGAYAPTITIAQNRTAAPITNAFVNYESIPFYGALNVAVGLKTVKGKLTDTPAYIYQVRNKLPLSKIKKANRIPKTIDGIPTDVVEIVESKPFYNHLSVVSNRSTYNNGTTPGLARQVFAVACGGTSTCYDNTYDANGGPYCGCAPDLASMQYSGLPSISHNTAYHSNGTVYGGVGVFSYIGSSSFGRGTMGIIAKEISTGKLVGITNNHVISSPSGEPTYGAVAELIDTNNSMIYRLGANFVYDVYNGVTPPCGLSTAAVWGTHFGTDYRVVAQVATPQADADLGNFIYNYVDAGLIAIQPDFAATDVHEIGQGYFPWVKKGTGIHDDFSNYIELSGKAVYKSGGTTGTKILIGHIVAANSHQYHSAEIGGNPYEIHFQDQIVIAPIDGSLLCNNIISMPGDSGSPILVEFDNKLKLIGILWGGNQLAGSNYSVISPIWRIAEIAGVEEWDGTIVVESTSPYIQLTKNERIYQIGQPTSSPTTHITLTELSTLPENPCN